MAPIIPAGGKKMDWVRDPEQPVQKKAQESMFDDDPQLSAIKDLPGMQDGIAELQEMTTDVVPPMDGTPAGAPPVEEVAPVVGGAVEKAIEKVKDAAEGVVDAVKKDVQTAVGDAVQNIGKPAEVAPVSGVLDEINPDAAHEETETPAEEVKEKHEKSESSANEKKEEECADKPKVPGVEGNKDGKVEKEGDKPAFAVATGMRRVADMSSDEVKGLRNYWETMLGFPSEYVDAMLKKYKA